IRIHQIEDDDLVFEQVLVEPDLLAFVGGQGDVRKETPPHHLSRGDRGREGPSRGGTGGGLTASRRQRAGQGEQGRDREQSSSRNAGHARITLSPLGIGLTAGCWCRRRSRTRTGASWRGLRG